SALPSLPPPPIPPIHPPSSPTRRSSDLYQDFPDARLIILWGANPSASGVHLVPHIREAQARGATLVVKKYRRIWSATGSPLKERSEEHTSELQSQSNLVCRLLLEKKKD